tara:strand:- start:187 stop:603 length:417 start_codon:yes stop_codon:yes gene_type:complete
VGILIHKIETKLKPEIIYAHIIDMDNYERQMSAMENVIGKKIPREIEVLDKVLNKKFSFIHQGVTNRYIIEPFNSGSTVTLEVKWSGISSTVVMGLFGTLRKIMYKIQFVTAIMEFEEGYFFSQKNKLNKNDSSNYIK